MINNLRTSHHNLPDEMNTLSHFAKRDNVDESNDILEKTILNDDYLSSKKLINEFDVSLAEQPGANKIAYGLLKHIENQKYHSSKLESNTILSSISRVERSVEPTSRNANDNKDKFVDSLSDLFDDIKSTINSGKADYLDVLRDLFSNYMDFVSAIRTLLSKLSECTKAGEKDGYININLEDLYNELKKLKDKYGSSSLLSVDILFERDEDGRYYREINGEKVYYDNESDVRAAMDTMGKLLEGIKGTNVLKGIESGYNNYVNPYLEFWFNAGVDTTDIENLLKSLKDKGLGSKDILQTEFDLLKKVLDAFEKKLNNNLDELSKKYSTANSNYDNFVKIVSSTMNTLLEMAKGFLRF